MPKDTAEPIKGKPGSFRLYFSLGKDPSTGKYRRSKMRTFHCRSKKLKNWPAEYRKELEGINEMPNSAQTLAEYATDFHTLRKTILKSPPLLSIGSPDTSNILKRCLGIPLLPAFA